MTASRYQLLVGATDFWRKAATDIADARRRVLIQAMTFESDAAGQGVADCVAASAAADRRVLVDDYSRNVINDTMLPLPFRPLDVKLEALATLDMFDALVLQGVGVRITNPVLGNPLRYPLRNHKKLLVMDDVAYIGGINFSDHNFAWHDLMLRIEDADVADFLAADFERDWDGQPMGEIRHFGDMELTTLDGSTNLALMQPLLDLVSQAKKSVELVSAYPTMPFVEAMAKAACRGAKVTVYTPAPNNKPIVRDYLTGVADQAGIRLRLLPEMTHVKAVLVDEDALVLGSSNFNFASFRTSNDIVAVIRDTNLIADFEARLLAPARAAGHETGNLKTSSWRQLRGRIALNFADSALSLLRHGPVRSIEWRRKG